MLIIRLQRGGRTHRPFYRIVVAQKHLHVSKKVHEYLGTYNPLTKEIVIKDKERVKFYLDNNVPFSDSAGAILEKEGLIEKRKDVKKYTKRDLEKEKAEAEEKAKKTADAAEKKEQEKADKEAKDAEEKAAAEESTKDADKSEDSKEAVESDTKSEPKDDKKVDESESASKDESAPEESK